MSNYTLSRWMNCWYWPWIAQSLRSSLVFYFNGDLCKTRWLRMGIGMWKLGRAYKLCETQIVNLQCSVGFKWPCEGHEFLKLTFLWSSCSQSIRQKADKRCWGEARTGQTKLQTCYILLCCLLETIPISSPHMLTPN